MTQVIENTTVAAATDAPAAPKLTRAEKQSKRLEVLRTRIEADTAEYHEIANELQNAAKFDSIVEGDIVQIKLGRKFADKDTTRIVAGVVSAIRTVEGESTQYKLQIGAGFAAELVVVEAGKIVGFGPVAEVAAA
jgi:hypothetical protein